MYFVQINYTSEKGKSQVKEQTFYLGMDIGTNSCGWALTDDSYQLAKINGKDAWGVRLFSEAETKEARRLKRTTRRRMVRKKLQNSWLRELFSEEINKVDNKFFDRLKYSNLWKEDKELMNPELTSKYSLFNDVLKSTYTDKEYYKQYKTVYHLRRELLDKPADDIRLLYLAIHSILTHRGHFLSGMSQSNDSGNSQNILTIIQDLFSKLTELTADSELSNNSFGLKCENTKFLDNLLENFNNLKSIRFIKEKLAEDLGAKTKLEKEIVSILVSGKSTTDKLFSRIDKEDRIEFDFDSDKFEDEVYGKLTTELTDDEIAVIDLLKLSFSNIQLRKVLGHNSYICQAMVEKYNKHQHQLKEFKAFVRKYYPSKMSLFFRKYPERNAKKSQSEDYKTVDNYAKYINSDLESCKKRYFDATATTEQFYKFVKKQLESLHIECMYNQQEFEAQKQYFIDLMEKNEFLPKIRSRENAVIPNGLYIKELKQILKVNASKYPFLMSKDETGLTVADKIISIVEFRVPYFVGPIGTYTGEERINGWAEKENNLDYKPWTLDKIVNFDKAEDAFIQRMTNKCTYLLEEDVLPNDSMLYSKFRVLNELNNLKINGNTISVELKQAIFNKLFRNYKKVSAKKLREFLVAENYFSKADMEQITISGIDKEFSNNYGSYVTLKGHFDEDFVELHQEDLEKVIKYHTIFSDKSRLENRIRREMKYLKDEDVKFLKSLNYSKWGRLSKKFLSGISFVNKMTGEITTIIEAMWQTNYNLMELMGKNFTLSEKLTERTKKLEKDLSYQDVEAMYCSPAVKRGVWQAIQIINEIKTKIGKYPDKIFVEVTRHNEEKGDKGRKDSRYKSLSKIYNSKELKSECHKYAIEYDELLNELNHSDNTNVRSDRLFLYFLQLGKCMYTGEPIDIADLYNDNLYDIDHIIPQSKLKDDSLNNKVLVKKDANRAKGDFYPICEICSEWITKQRPYWEMLQKRGLISQEKLSRLIRKDKFTDADANDFVNRQMVITNQETKAVIDLLKTVIDNPNNIVFSKAKFVSDFRKKYGIYKSRNINNFHHAKDAYLNIVVGDVLRTRFTESFWKREDTDINNGITANINKLFDNKVWSNKTRNIVWNGTDDVLKVQQICNKNTCAVSIMPYINENGMFYDESIYKSTLKQGSSKASINIKGSKDNPLSSIEKYGGYNSMKGAYFMVVESLNRNGRPQTTIETVPILVNYSNRKSANKQQKIIEYLQKENNIKITRIILDKLKYNSLLKINGGLYKLTGKTGNSYKILKASEWHIDNKTVEYIKIIEKYLGYSEEFRKELPQSEDKIVVSKSSKNSQSELVLNREKNMQLYEIIIKQLSKSIYNVSSIQGVKSLLVQKRDTFNNLSVDNQTKLLNGLVGYVGGAYFVDLTLIGGASLSGGSKINKDITDLDISLVCQSVSGMNQKEIKL